MNLKSRLAALEDLIAGERANAVIVFNPCVTDPDYAEQLAAVEAAKQAALGIVLDQNDGFEVWKYGMQVGGAGMA